MIPEEEMNKNTERNKGEIKNTDDIKWIGHKGRVYGATMHKKSKDTLRLVFGNINTLPKEKKTDTSSTFGKI